MYTTVFFLVGWTVLKVASLQPEIYNLTNRRTWLKPTPENEAVSPNQPRTCLHTAFSPADLAKAGKRPTCKQSCRHTELPITNLYVLLTVTLATPLMS